MSWFPSRNGSFFAERRSKFSFPDRHKVTFQPYMKQHGHNVGHGALAGDASDRFVGLADLLRLC